MSENKPHPMTGIRPEIRECTIEVLKLTTSMDIDVYDAMEIFLRALASVALDAANGDCALAAKWMDEWLIPNIKHFRDQLEKGGNVTPIIVDGHTVN